MLELRNVTVRYGPDRSTPPAIEGIDLTIADDEVVCILGPSGSGKTTLLRAIVGLEPLTSGTVSRDGHDQAGVPPHRRDIGLMFQDHALFPHRDVLANVAFGPRVRRAPHPQQRARDTLALVGLTGYEHRRVSQLSGGEQQRVALARALAAEPHALMLDEPLGSLDRELRERLAEELRALFNRLELGVLFVTHDHDEAFAIADRIAVLRSGHIEQIDTPAGLWRRPRTAFVARFLGWDVTDAFGDRAAVRPGGLRLGTDGLAATVVTCTFRRDHFVVAARPAHGGELHVVVDADELPRIGEQVHLAPTDDDTIVPLTVEDEPTS
jgi:thiamine transport system ATP-binding protein